jgi:hypothetical protein
VCKKHRLSFLGTQEVTIGSVDFKHKGKRDGYLIGMYREISHKIWRGVVAWRGQAIFALPPPHRQNRNNAGAAPLDQQQPNKASDQTNNKQINAHLSAI